MNLNCNLIKIIVYFDGFFVFRIKNKVYFFDVIVGVFFGIFSYFIVYVFGDYRSRIFYFFSFYGSKGYRFIF